MYGHHGNLVRMTSEPIASRRLAVVNDPTQAVTVTIGKPMPDPELEAWVCLLDIQGIPTPHSEWLHGLDSMHAIQQALEAASHWIRSSDLQLVWERTPGDTGFPRYVPWSINYEFVQAIERYIDDEIDTLSEFARQGPCIASRRLTAIDAPDRVIVVSIGQPVRLHTGAWACRMNIDGLPDPECVIFGCDGIETLVGALERTRERIDQSGIPIAWGCLCLPRAFPQVHGYAFAEQIQRRIEGEVEKSIADQRTRES